MTPTETDEQMLIEEELQILSQLHPGCSRAELREARDNLVDYYNFVWDVFLRMREDGRLNGIFDKGKS